MYETLYLCSVLCALIRGLQDLCNKHSIILNLFLRVKVVLILFLELGRGEVQVKLTSSLSSQEYSLGRGQGGLSTHSNLSMHCQYNNRPPRASPYSIATSCLKHQIQNFLGDMLQTSRRLMLRVYITYCRKSAYVHLKTSTSFLPPLQKSGSVPSDITQHIVGCRRSDYLTYRFSTIQSSFWV